MKRVIEVIASAFLTTALTPLFVVIAFIIWVDSPGPIIFVQRRVGRGERAFDIYKFRTMFTSSDPIGPSPTDERDRRITRIGRILRPSKLDELPQLWNVVRGEMSFVGPRPQLANELEDYLTSYPALLATRASVRPGITSPWCISTVGRKDHPSLAMLESDCEYVMRDESLKDLFTIGRTIQFIFGRLCSRRVRAWRGEGARDG